MRFVSSSAAPVRPSCLDRSSLSKALPIAAFLWNKLGIQGDQRRVGVGASYNF